ncbi:RNA 2',3'-cyclic phosphodiesterase [Virgibacillus ainsalahensis]
MASHYFIAIPVPESLQNFFSEWQRQFKHDLNYRQWTQREDLHITLKFLGPVADDKLRYLEGELYKLEQLQAFHVNVGTIGTFGKPERPSVLWAGVEKTDALSRLQQMVEACTGVTGFPKENRPYRPHITLAKKWFGEEAPKAVGEIKKEFTKQMPMHVNEVILYQIYPDQSPKYKPVATFRLEKGEKNGSID